MNEPRDPSEVSGRGKLTHDPSRDEGVGPGHGDAAGPSRRNADELERLIGNLARSQPLRRAPGSLEARVFAQISAQPWWRKGFAHWPLPARAAFLVASLGFVKLVLTGFMSAVDLLHSSDVAGVTALHQTGAAVSTTVSLGEMVFHAIPAAWLYAGAAVGFTLYAVLFGLGTFAYRTLYVQR